MNDTNLAYSYQINEWKLPEWNYLVNEISNVFRFSDDEKNRFENSYTARLIASIPFEAGNKEIINHGMNILALIMLEGYKNSINKDKTHNVYNPILSGAWNYQTIKNNLLTEINKSNVPNFDWIFTKTPLNLW